MFKRSLVSLLLFLTATVAFASDDDTSSPSASEDEPKKIGIVYFVQLLNQPPLVQPTGELNQADVNDAVNNKLPTRDFAQANPNTGLLLIRPLIIAEQNEKDEEERTSKVSILQLLVF